MAEEAAKRKDDIYVDAGDLSLSDKWGTSPTPTMSIPQIIDRIETAKAWIVMKHVEVNPAYKAILDEYEAFVRDIAGPEGSKLLRNAEMLVSSPRQIGKRLIISIGDQLSRPDPGIKGPLGLRSSWIEA